MQTETVLFPEVKKMSLRTFQDERGFFQETFRAKDFPYPFVQDNHSFSQQHVIRGMHFQRFPGQVKLVSVIEGAIFDVVVDIRPESQTFGQWRGVTLEASKREQLLIPVGFAHGFCVLSPSAHVMYKVSSYYDPEQEATFRFDDPNVGIVWPTQTPIISSRDSTAKLLCEVIT
jgi:dTDP-4-dehydrorhamnose 3,5-epimerase